MKKVIFLLIVLATLCQGMSLFAQDKKRNESDYYYVNVSLERIYSHRLGYMVVYRKSSNLMGRVFLPVEWFSGVAGKGELIGLRSGSEWPSLSVYYKDGEFSHVKLRARWNNLHQTWAMIPLNVDIDEAFKNVEDIKLEL